MSISEQIKQKLYEVKPDTSPTTGKAYISTLNNLYIKNKASVGQVDWDWLNNPDEIEKAVETRPINSKKVIYSALLALFPENTTYKELIMKYRNELLKRAGSGEKSEREEANWIEFDEVKAKYDELASKYVPLLKANATQVVSIPELSNFFLFVLTSGVLIPPRRSMDWSEMKIRNYDKDTDNYYENGVFYFNKYKTANVYGQQSVAVPAKLKLLLGKYAKKNPYDYLLITREGTKLHTSGIAVRLNEIMGKKISTTMFRHIYLSNIHRNTPNLQELKQTATDMGHSVEMGIEYARK